MAGIESLQPVREYGWLQGLRTLLRKENQAWWGTRKWWINALVWTAIINGSIAIMLWVIPVTDPEEVTTMEEAKQIFLILFGLFATIGVIVLVQGAIVGEKQTGTAQWVMSNPVSPGAFILSKLVANSISILVILVLLQSLLFYGQISLSEGESMPVEPFVQAIALVTLSLFFFLTLTLMLGTMRRKSPDYAR